MEPDYTILREQMVSEFIEMAVTDSKVIAAISSVPRHLFVPKEYRVSAYEDESLPIGYNQTISQPSLVAMMTSLLQIKGEERVLEIGTGSGYQAAILSMLARKVYTIERIPELAAKAEKLLKKLNLSKNVSVITGDGTLGLPDKALFDAIMVTARGPKIPNTLISQLKDGGRIVMPVEKEGGEELVAGIKKGEKLLTANYGSVHFVPLIGKYGR